MNTDKSTQATTSAPVAQPAEEVTNQQLMAKLLELEKKIDLIEQKLATPLIS
jgi:hypothetical protein